MFGFKKSFNASQVNGYELEQNKHMTYGTFDMFLFHSVWNYTEVRKVVPHGPAVTLIRDPVDTFESGYVYFNNHPKVNKFYHHLEIFCFSYTMKIFTYMPRTQ